MTNYTTRWVWPTNGGEYDRESMQSRAHNLWRRLEEMVLFRHRHAPLDIWRIATQCAGLALAGGDPVMAANAREIADRFSPRKSLAERRAIHRKATALLASHTPASSSSHKKSRRSSNQIIDAKFHKLAALLDKLRMRTVARGCTLQEARAAKAAVFGILRGNQNTGLSPAEMETFRCWYSRSEAT
jgi:hypothetical protein